MSDDFNVNREILRTLLQQLRKIIAEFWQEYKNAGEETWYSLKYKYEICYN